MPPEGEGQPNPQTEKLYCYVDETGQDTKGKWFLVSVVIVEKEKLFLEQVLEEIEEKTKKKKLKWNKTKRNRQQAYLENILKLKELKYSLYFSIYEDTKLFADLVVLSTAKAIIDKSRGNYKANIVVDGLTKNLEKQFSSSMRKLNVSINKVKGARDESSSLVRLADSLAGALRSASEGDKLFSEMIKKLEDRKFLKNI